jgi:hypothetical protein
MVTQIKFKTGNTLQFEYSAILNTFITPYGNMKPAKFYQWLKDFSKTQCTHEDTIETNKGAYRKSPRGYNHFVKTNLKLCQTCRAKIK